VLLNFANPRYLPLALLPTQTLSNTEKENSACEILTPAQAGRVRAAKMIDSLPFRLCNGKVYLKFMQSTVL